MKKAKIKIEQAINALTDLGLPKAQQNDRTALCLLALLNLKPDSTWSNIENPLIGITPIIEFAMGKYKVKYMPNTRESIRKQSMHQLVSAGLVLLNPDEPTRSVNSPKTVYQIEPSAYELLKKVATDSWKDSLNTYLITAPTLITRYAKEREMQQIPVKISEGKVIQISPGAHSLLIKAIIEEFASRFVPGGILIYVGDTGDKFGYYDQDLMDTLGVNLDMHGKMPDVAIFYPDKNWLLLVESVTSHGAVDGKRHEELAKLFSTSKAPIVYVTAFPSRTVMAPYLGIIAWETEVWCADSPTHLIHFNGSRFLGPY